MDTEIDQFLKHARDIRESHWNYFIFREATLSNRNVVIVKSGVGKVFAAMVSTLNNIPFLVVRTIADKADGTAVKDFNKFLPIVAKNSYTIVNSIIKKV